MGGAVSAGETNDELIDNLIEGKYIRSENVIEAFRAVDRAIYYLPEHRESAYHDMAWKHGNLHLSAPCIYAEVMEALEMKPGLSFLNIGSGTGYVSTMCGLLLGPMGVNHGIEIHEDVIEYANKRLNHFMMTARYDFCKPTFIAGDATKLSSDTPGYDRIYCGAACPIEYKNYMRNLLNIGGKMVIPLADKLVIIDRTGQSSWEDTAIMSVSFATLIVTSRQEACQSFPIRQCPTLHNICRYLIRRSIRLHCINDINIEKSKRKRPVKRHSSKSDFEVMDTETVSSSSEPDSDSDDESKHSENYEDDNNTNKTLSNIPNNSTIVDESDSQASSSTNQSSENQNKWPSARRHQRKLRLIQRLQGYALQTRNPTQSQSERGVMAILSSVLRRRNHRVARDRENTKESETMEKEEEYVDDNNEEVLLEETTFNQAILSLPLPLVIKRFLIYERFLFY